MSAIRRAMMAQVGVHLVPFCDDDGNQVTTTLPDGVLLNVSNVLKNYRVYDNGGASLIQRVNPYMIDLSKGTATYVGINFPFEFVEGKYYYMCANYTLFDSNTKYIRVIARVRSSGITNIAEYIKENQKLSSFGKCLSTVTNIVFAAESARSGTMEVKNPMAIDVDYMFENATDYMPSSTEDFEDKFGCVGNISVDAKVVALKGKLWYAE